MDSTRSLSRACIVIASCALSACGDDEGESGGGASGASSVFVQGHVQGREPLAGAPETFSGLVTGAHYDRCNPDALFDLVELGLPAVTFSVPAILGKHSTGFAGGGPSGPAAGGATVEITHIDEWVIEGFFSSSSASGGFVLDACGHFGQSLFAVETCTLSDGASSRVAVAISPSGRIAVSDISGWTRVFRQSTSGDSCTYEPDPDYGAAGLFDARAEQLEFDASERLYAATFPNAIHPDTPGGIVRLAPDGTVESCLNASKPTAGISDDPPHELAVLRDGSVAYAYWAGATERRIDLTSPAVGSGLVECDYETSTDSEVRYANALAVHDDGFLFLRNLSIDGPVHAEVTNLTLDSALRFGGTSSGKGALGFVETGAGTRCPAGYCMASRTGLAVFSDKGEFRHFIQWYTLLEGESATGALAATEGSADDAYVAVEVGDGVVGVRLSMP
jgi:hypothetical protein